MWKPACSSSAVRRDASAIVSVGVTSISAANGASVVAPGMVASHGRPERVATARIGALSGGMCRLPLRNDGPRPSVWPRRASFAASSAGRVSAALTKTAPWQAMHQGAVMNSPGGGPTGHLSATCLGGFGSGYGSPYEAGQAPGGGSGRAPSRVSLRTTLRRANPSATRRCRLIAAPLPLRAGVPGGGRARDTLSRYAAAADREVKR